MSIDFDGIVNELYPLLNASGETDLVWWDGDELTAFMDEASDALGSTGLFAEFTDADGTAEPIDVAAGGSTYDLPANCASVIDVEFDGSALRRATVSDLEARSTTWADDTGTPTHFVLEEFGHRHIRLWPTPDADGTANLVYATWPNVTDGTTHRVPSVYGLFHKYSALAAARGKACDGQDLAIAEAARQRADLITQACKGLFGGVK